MAGPLHRCARAISLIAIATVAGACETTREYPLQALRDRVDRPGRQNQSLADIGQAPIKRHAPDLDFVVRARFVEPSRDDESNARRAFHIEVEVRNDSDAPLRMRGLRWWLRDDAGERFACRALLAWDAERDEWRPSDGTVDAGARTILVAQFPVSSRYVFEHLMRITLHWRYAHREKTHTIATSFRSR